MSKHTPGKWERESAQDGEYTGPGDNPPGYAGDYYETNSVGVLDPETGDWTAVADCYRGADADLVSAAPDYHKAVADLLSLWPLSGYELEAYMGATFIPAVLAAQRKAEGGAA